MFMRLGNYFENINMTSVVHFWLCKYKFRVDTFKTHLLGIVLLRESTRIYIKELIWKYHLLSAWLFIVCKVRNNFYI